MEGLAAIFFALAILHTFSVKFFQNMALRFKSGSIPENFFHLLGEVEVVFGLWAALLFGVFCCFHSYTVALMYLESRDFDEAIFVFVIMTIAATKPILFWVQKFITACSSALPINPTLSFYFFLLGIGPLLGSFITEPAAMTVLALLLKPFFAEGSNRFRLITLATLFVNVSIGGVLTHFAAPPVIMVSKLWMWNTPFMFTQFGLRAILATLTNGVIATIFFRTELLQMKIQNSKKARDVPFWLFILHAGFIALIVPSLNHPHLMMGVFLLFLGIVQVTREFQTDLKLKESLLVGFFLGGLIFLGGFQEWWLAPLIQSMEATPLYFASTALTAIVDNAAITYLGSLAGDLSSLKKYALVAGAVSGGGLTLIANAPNPAGYALLKHSFGKTGVQPLSLLAWAALPTLVVIMLFWIL